MPSNEEELVFMAEKLDRLVGDEEDGKQNFTSADLRTMFMQLSAHYEDVGEEAYENDEFAVDDFMPFTVGDLK